MKIKPQVVFWVCCVGFLACRIAFAWRMMPGYQLFDSPVLSILMLLFCGGAFWARHQGFAHPAWLPTTAGASKRVRIILGILVVSAIFYFARVAFNEYYGPLAQATNGGE